MARSVPDSAWIPALAQEGVVVADPTTFVNDLASLADERVIRTVVRLTLIEQVPATFDAPVAALVQQSPAWESALNAELDVDRIEFWSMLLKIKPQGGSD